MQSVAHWLRNECILLQVELCSHQLATSQSLHIIQVYLYFILRSRVYVTNDAKLIINHQQGATLYFGAFCNLYNVVFYHFVYLAGGLLIHLEKLSCETFSDGQSRVQLDQLASRV